MQGRGGAGRAGRQVAYRQLAKPVLLALDHLSAKEVDVEADDDELEAPQVLAGAHLRVERCVQAHRVEVVARQHATVVPHLEDHRHGVEVLQHGVKSARTQQPSANKQAQRTAGRVVRELARGQTQESQSCGCDSHSELHEHRPRLHVNVSAGVHVFDDRPDGHTRCRET